MSTECTDHLVCKDHDIQGAQDVTVQETKTSQVGTL